jgi:hypothetical protein
MHPRFGCRQKPRGFKSTNVQSPTLECRRTGNGFNYFLKAPLIGKDLIEKELTANYLIS